jgi:ribosomal protein S18 acetylase RimI-like enzyme
MESHTAQPFRVRSATPTDIAGIVELSMTLADSFPANFLPLIDRDLRNHTTLVGTLGDDTVGFIIWMYRDPQTAEILWFGIKEEYQGLGLGTMMLQALEKLVGDKNITRLVASTLSYTVDYKPYEKVRAFYYNRGFKSLGIQQDFYHEGLDRLVLMKTLR